MKRLKSGSVCCLCDAVWLAGWPEEWGEMLETSPVRGDANSCMQIKRKWTEVRRKKEGSCCAGRRRKHSAWLWKGEASDSILDWWGDDDDEAEEANEGKRGSHQGPHATRRQNAAWRFAPSRDDRKSDNHIRNNRNGGKLIVIIIKRIPE